MNGTVFDQATTWIAGITAVAVFALRSWFQIVAATRAVMTAEQTGQQGPVKRQMAVRDIEELHPIMRPLTHKGATRLVQRAWKRKIGPSKAKP